jgi:hypothetical protein
MSKSLAVRSDEAVSIRFGIGRMVRAAGLALAVAAAGLGISIPPSHAEAGGVKLSQLSWIVGHWEGTSKGSQVETHWGAPLGDSMLGVFRASQDGKAKFYEILVLEQETAGPVLTLKHFGRKLVGWEGEPAPLSYPLVSLSDTEAVFANPSAGGSGEGARRIVYQKTGDNGLSVLLEGYREGKILTNEFRFSRRNSPV